MTIPQDHPVEYHYVVADPFPRPILLDPDAPEDCRALSDALFNETGTEIDPLALGDALRAVRDAR